MSLAIPIPPAKSLQMNRIRLIVHGFVRAPHNMGHKRKIFCKFCFVRRSIRRSVAKVRVFSGSSDATTASGEPVCTRCIGLCNLTRAGVAIRSVAAALKERFAIDKLRKKQ